MKGINTNILIGTIGVDGDIHDQYRISTNDFIENKYLNRKFGLKRI